MDKEAVQTTRRAEITWYKNKLEVLYLQDGLTIGDIANMKGVCARTVKRVMQTFGIPLRSTHEVVTLDYSMGRRTSWNKGKILGKWNTDELKELYWQKQLNLKEISKMKHVAPSTISHVMEYFGIPKRTPSEVHKLLCSKGNTHLPPRHTGEKHPMWKGGRRKTKDGYILVLSHNHPRATKANHGYVFEHILVWEQTHERLLPKGYTIHHINGIKDDNRPENLVAIPSPQNKPYHFQKILQQKIKNLEMKLAKYESFV